MTKPILNSAVAIARLLGTEGFTDHVANECERYYRRNCVLTERQKRSLASVERAFSKMVESKLDDTDRLVLGKFIGWQKKLSFDTGLRIGLQAFATKHATQDATNGDQFADVSKMVATNDDRFADAGKVIAPNPEPAER